MKELNAEKGVPNIKLKELRSLDTKNLCYACGNRHRGACAWPLCKKCRNRHGRGVRCDHAARCLRATLATYGLADATERQQQQGQGSVSTLP